MSKRVADFQLTNENYELHESDVGGVIGSSIVAEDGRDEDIIESKEEIGARKMVKIKKRFDDLNAIEKVAFQEIEYQKREEAGQVTDSGSSSSPSSSAAAEQEDPNLHVVEAGEGETKSEDDNQKKGTDEAVENSEGDGHNEKGGGKEEVLPFGNSGLSSSFKNPFLTLAANSEGSNFLFSSFKGGGLGDGGENLSGSGAEAQGEDEEEELNEEEPENKVFTGEEQEETVYQCKNVDLFMLKALDNGEKSFKKFATGIVHLNIPKGAAPEKPEEKHSEPDSGSCSNKDLESEKVVTQPRMIFRQKGVYKVLLNSPLSAEISKTFQRNRNIRKGFATNFIAFGQDSEIQQCMFRFQNETDLVEFMEKLDQIVKGDST
ncbi:PH/NUP50/RAN binding domain containing protein [Cryptosporidium felis]|nr:PH/NUP50/RAN binding domain containing protein [Cryptosporidium felis]